MKILQRFRRWRRSFGFGVHSPFAYRFIKEVLCPNSRYAYYAYADIIGYMRVNNIRYTTLSKALLIFRIIHTLRPATITIADNNSSHFIKFIASKACPESKITDVGGELLVCIGQSHAPSGSRHAIFTDISHPLCKQMTSSMTSGHVYTNLKSSIIVNLSHLPFQTFEVKF